MDKNLDFRVQRTYITLQNALLELLSEKKFEEITVGELCEKAMIRRATFYKHFGDKYELFSFAIRELLEDFQWKNTSEYDRERPDTFLVGMIDYSLQFVEHHSSTMQSLLKSNNSHVLFDILSTEIELDIRKHLRQNADNGALLPAAPELLAAMVTGALVYTMKWWISQDMQTPRQELVHACASFVGMDQPGSTSDSVS